MSARRVPRLWPALLLAWLAAVSGASAESAAQPTLRAVVLDSRGCAEIPQQELRDLVALELSPRPLFGPGGVARGARASFARLACNGTRAELRVDDPERGASQQLELDLAETMASARTRLVALALSELIATLEMEREDAVAQPEPAVPVAKAPTAGGAYAATTERGRAWLGLGFSRAGQPALWGVAMHGGGRWQLGALPLAAQLDLRGTRAQRGLSEGQVSAWTLAGSVALAAVLRRSWLEAALAAGLSLGYGWLRGSSASSVEVAGNLVRAPWWGPSLEGSVLVPVRRRWGIRAALELGYVAKPVRGLDSTGQPAYALEGFQLLGTAAVSVSF